MQLLSLFRLYIQTLITAGTKSIDALNSGFNLAFIGAVVISVIAAILSTVYIKMKIGTDNKV
ncbi:MAG: hypothetical protein M3Z01_08415 [Thermoproteota archaeon]|nr:hypothetical protein [Thermoproteota archaeon]